MFAGHETAGKTVNEILVLRAEQGADELVS